MAGIAPEKRRNKFSGPRDGAAGRKEKRMQKHGGDVYRQHYRMDYSVNVNPLGTPESVMAAACEGIRHSAQYPDVDCGALREKLAKAERVEGNQLIFGNGAADLIFSLALAMKPKTVLLPAPTFAEYEQAVKIVESRVIHHDLTEAEFEGKKYPIPVHYDDYLRHWYGDHYMELLPVSQRTSVHDVIRIDLGEYLTKDSVGKGFHQADLRGELFEAKVRGLSIIYYEGI